MPHRLWRSEGAFCNDIGVCADDLDGYVVCGLREATSQAGGVLDIHLVSQNLVLVHTQRAICIHFQERFSVESIAARPMKREGEGAVDRVGGREQGRTREHLGHRSHWSYWS